MSEFIPVMNLDDAIECLENLASKRRQDIEPSINDDLAENKAIRLLADNAGISG